MNYPKSLIIKLSLYAVLIICSFILLIYSSHQYEESVTDNEKDENVIVCLSYLKTKVMMAENVDVITYKNRQMLFIDHETYDNYVFYDDGMLYEITVVNDYQFEPNEAEAIISVDNLEIEESGDYISFEAETERLLVKK